MAASGGWPTSVSSNDSTLSAMVVAQSAAFFSIRRSSSRRRTSSRAMPTSGLESSANASPFETLCRTFTSTRDTMPSTGEA